uniref:Uncharacterized protein n=1 Tax=Arundo donax TaxID=35708 RepID=A0A0A8Y8X3_ARUDO
MCKLHRHLSRLQHDKIHMQHPQHHHPQAFLQPGEDTFHHYLDCQAAHKQSSPL